MLNASRNMLPLAFGTPHPRRERVEGEREQVAHGDHLHVSEMSQVAID